jgi:hypothetical protein
MQNRLAKLKLLGGSSKIQKEELKSSDTTKECESNHEMDLNSKDTAVFSSGSKTVKALERCFDLRGLQCTAEDFS